MWLAYSVRTARSRRGAAGGCFAVGDLWQTGSDAMTTTARPSGTSPGGETVEAIRLGRLSDALGFRLRLAHAATFRAFNRHAAGQDLRPGWYAVLSLIADNPGINPVALSRASGRDKSTITPVLRQLDRGRMIRQSPVPGDRRSYGLRLTAAGEEALARLAVVAARHDRALDAIAGADRAVLMEVLRRLVAELDRPAAAEEEPPRVTPGPRT